MELCDYSKEADGLVVVVVKDDRRIGRVGRDRDQPAVSGTAEVFEDDISMIRIFITGDEQGADVLLFNIVFMRIDQHDANVVTRHDASAGHGVALNLEGENGGWVLYLIPTQAVLLGKYRCAGGDPPDQGACI